LLSLFLFPDFCGSKKCVNFSFDLFLGLGAWLKSFSPTTPKMKNIPRRFLLLVSSGAGIVVSKSIHQVIPKWLKSLDQERFGKRNPNIIHDKKSALKIVTFQIRGLRDGLGMF